MLFGAEQNRGLLISLLNAVLQPRIPIESVEVLHAQPERASVDDKSIALDVLVRLATGEEVDVEMQSQRRPALRERALYYWARLYAGQLQRGDSYFARRRGPNSTLTEGVRGVPPIPSASRSKAAPGAASSSAAVSRAAAK
jgi:hypothetical protein